MTYEEHYAARIAEVHATLPETATLDERAKAIAPIGSNIVTSWGRKAWQKARKKYLGRYGYRGRGEQAALSPLEKMMARSPR
ncbi:hypothetical protein GOA90_25325 [Sinorhizobium meliloti]|nr:hypothetical protein [Sinorhizobium meliloti]